MSERFVHFATPAELERERDAMRRVEEYLRRYRGKASLDYVKMFLIEEVCCFIPQEFATAETAKHAEVSVFRVVDGIVMLPVIEPFPLPVV